MTERALDPVLNMRDKQHENRTGHLTAHDIDHIVCDNQLKEMSDVIIIIIIIIIRIIIIFIIIIQ
jgi:hypothetical protein